MPAFAGMTPARSCSVGASTDAQAPARREDRGEERHGCPERPQQRHVSGTPRSGAPDRAGVRPGRGTGARARGGARARIGRRSKGPLSARAPRRRRARRRAHASDRGGQHHSAVRRAARSLGEGGRAQPCAGGGTAAHVARTGLPGRNRGGRSQAQRAATRGVRAREDRRGAALLPRRGTGSGSPHRCGDARGRPLDLARGARHAHPAARRRPPGIAPRASQARAVRAGEGAGRARRRHGGGRRCLDARTRWPDRCRLCRAHRRARSPVRQGPHRRNRRRHHRFRRAAPGRAIASGKTRGRGGRLGRRGGGRHPALRSFQPQGRGRDGARELDLGPARAGDGAARGGRARDPQATRDRRGDRAAHAAGARRRRASKGLARDPEKWEPVFGKDHAQNRRREVRIAMHSCLTIAMRWRRATTWPLARALTCAFAFALAHLAPAHAQSTPAKTIKLVVPFGPGGPTDVSARLVAQVLQSALAQSVVIENRPGAGGALGTKSVATAEPNGATLLIGTSATLGVVPALMKNPGYDPIRSFAPVAKVADSTLVLVTPASFPASSVKEFIDYAKANAGKLSYASAGVGNQTQLLAELSNTKSAIDVLHVPYKSGAEMVTAILGQQVQMAFPDVSILIPLIREGKLKALAVTSAQRHPQLPDVPTMIESGSRDDVMTFCAGVVAPAGTPVEIVEKLNGAINDGLKSPAVRDSLVKVGAQASPGSPKDFADFIVAETEKWRAVAKMAGISLD